MLPLSNFLPTLIEHLNAIRQDTMIAPFRFLLKKKSCDIPFPLHRYLEN